VLVKEASSKEIGREAEDKALDYLKKQGLQLVRRNFNCRVGEIDLIMRDKNYLVFVEVRSRVSDSFGGGIGSITAFKKRKLIKTASYYTMCNKNSNQYPLRFDVVSLDGKPGKVTWIKDAFNADY
jgi:putative endonuclease